MTGLTPLLERTRGSPEIVVAMIDGPVLLSHQDLREADVRLLPGSRPARDRAECAHGTFIAAPVPPGDAAPERPRVVDAEARMRPMTMLRSGVYVSMGVLATLAAAAAIYRSGGAGLMFLPLATGG